MIHFPSNEDPVLFHPGDIPVILSAPHAVSLAQSNCLFLEERKSGLKIEELYILAFITALAHSLEQNWARPYLYLARVHRSRIDFARSQTVVREENAFDDPRAAEIFKDYECRLQSLCAGLTRSHPTVILLDIHGCVTHDYDLFLGTLNGKTDTLRDGRHLARDAFQSALSQRGWRVAPSPGEREIRFSGRSDSVIARHNLAGYPGLHASIQVEISAAIRENPTRRARLARHMAEAIHQVFLNLNTIHSPME